MVAAIFLGLIVAIGGDTKVTNSYRYTTRLKTSPTQNLTVRVKQFLKCMKLLEQILISVLQLAKDRFQLSFLIQIAPF